MFIDTLLIAKTNENINANQLLNEVGCVCSMGLPRRHSKGRCCTKIYKYNTPSSACIHIHICMTIRTHSKHTHTHRGVRVYTETLTCLSLESGRVSTAGSRRLLFSPSPLLLFDI